MRARERDITTQDGPSAFLSPVWGSEYARLLPRWACLLCVLVAAACAAGLSFTRPGVCRGVLIEATDVLAPLTALGWQRCAGGDALRGPDPGAALSRGGGRAIGR